MGQIVVRREQIDREQLIKRAALNAPTSTQAMRDFQASRLFRVSGRERSSAPIAFAVPLVWSKEIGVPWMIWRHAWMFNVDHGS